MIIKKTNMILVPYIILSLPAFLMLLVDVPLKSFLLKIISPFSCVHAVGWFLICMFWCYLIYYGILRIVKGKLIYALVFSVILSVISFISNYMSVKGHQFRFPYFMSTSFYSLPLICIGNISSSWIKKVRELTLTLIIFIISFICSWGGNFSFV